MIVKEKYFEIVDEALSHNFLGKIAVDATVGKGNDCLLYTSILHQVLLMKNYLFFMQRT